VVGVLGQLLDGGQLFADVIHYEALQILADDLVDEYLLASGGFGVGGEVVDVAGLGEGTCGCRRGWSGWSSCRW
jgi:hypothetical protein